MIALFRIVLVSALFITPRWTQSSKPAGKTDPQFLKRQQVSPLAPAPAISDVQHVVIHYDKHTYCGHPREIIFQYFGNGEMVLGHYHAPCKYQVYDDVRHISYQSRSVALMQRSFDDGRTWPKDKEVVLFDNSRPPDEKRGYLFGQRDVAREKFDMFRPESLFFFGRTRFSSDDDAILTCFLRRSADKGYTWEKVPIVVPHPSGKEIAFHRHNTPIVRMPDGKTLLAPFQMPNPDSDEWEGDAAILSSTDQGLTWKFLSRPLVDKSRSGQFVYVTLLTMPGGELQCYLLHLAKSGKTPNESVEGLKNNMCRVISRDGGRTWSEPLPIAGLGGGCWKDPGKDGSIYRSPYPILLKDGRILVMFARRRMPGGIGGIISRDGGTTWSEEFVIRDDGKWWDLGYPVACELEDGRIFTAYYWPMQDGNGMGGTRAIIGTFFKIDSGG